MRTLQLHFPDDALSTLNTLLKQTKEARVFRRAQAVREVVKGAPLQTVSDPLAFPSSALSQWGHRLAHEGAPGLLDRPRSGRPPKVTCALAQPLKRLVEPDPLHHGSLYAPWSWRALATVLAHQTGIQLGRESVRCLLKKREALAVPPAGLLPARLLSPTALLHSLPWSIRRVGGKSFGSLPMKRSCGALPGPGWAGGAKPDAPADPRVH
jgi:transposase